MFYEKHDKFIWKLCFRTSFRTILWLNNINSPHMYSLHRCVLFFMSELRITTYIFQWSGSGIFFAINAAINLLIKKPFNALLRRFFKFRIPDFYCTDLFVIGYGFIQRGFICIQNFFYLVFGNMICFQCRMIGIY